MTGDVSASQEQLLSDVVDSNRATKKGKRIRAYPKMSPDKVSHDQRETKQYGLRKQHNQTEIERSIEGTLSKKEEVNFIHVC